MDLAAMRKGELVALYGRMLTERGSVTLVGGPRTADEYRTAIRCMRRQDAAEAAHRAEAGPGHERCPYVNFKPACGRLRIDT